MPSEINARTDMPAAEREDAPGSQSTGTQRPEALSGLPALSTLPHRLDDLALLDDTDLATVVCTVARLWADRGRDLTVAVNNLLASGEHGQNWQWDEFVAQAEDITF